MPGPSSTGPSGQGSATRLLVLGCVRIFQPVHGYFLRRELMSWQVDDWANIHPGSIYNALRTLTRSGLLEEVGTAADGPRPPRTTYRLTPAGDVEFLALVRAGLVETDDLPLCLTAVNMAYALPRAEVVAAIETRIAALENYLTFSDAAVESILAAPDTPDTASEIGRLMSARTRGELEWANAYLGRLRSGAYAFDGEPPLWSPTPEQIETARLAGVGPGVLFVEAEGHGLLTRNSQG